MTVGRNIPWNGIVCHNYNSFTSFTTTPMNTIELLKVTPHKDVIDIAKTHYKLKKKFTIAIIKRILAAKKKRKQDHPGEEVIVKQYTDDDGTQIYDTQTNMFSFSFRDRDTVLNIPIANTTLDTYSPEFILASIIRELTRYGDEGQAKKRKNDLVRRIRKIKKGIVKPETTSSYEYPNGNIATPHDTDEKYSVERATGEK